MSDKNSPQPENSGAEANNTEADDLMARLRAADPAIGVEPRSGFAEQLIADATGAVEASPIDLAAERETRRPLWYRVVGAAAAVAIIGGVGYGVGATTGGSTVSTGTAAPISLGGGSTEGGAVETDSKMSPRLGAQGATDMIYPGIYPGYGGRTTFTASGLSTTAGTGLAYGFDARSASTIENIAALAAALGVAGTPELKDGSWIVGAQDGTAPSLYVSLDGVLSFNYYNPLLNPWACEKAGGACEPAAPVPSEQAATDSLRALLVSLGFDLAGFELGAQTWEGSPTMQATATRLVDGQRTDQAIYMDVAGEGILSVYGQLATTVELGEYAVVSEQEAFERLSDRRFGGFFGGGGVIAYARDDAATTEWVPPTEPPATPGAGSKLAWPVTEVHIVSARLGLASQWQPDGGVLLVPAYEFTDADGGTWSVIAVADSMLDFSAE